MSANTIIGLSILEQQEANNRDRMYRKNQADIDAVISKDKADLLAYKNASSQSLLKYEARLVKLERDKVAKENLQYKDLLCKPMAEIAEKNGDFKKTYQLQQAAIAEWMVSQRSFKELAMQYGKKEGKTPEQVIAEAEAIKENVINNTTEFGNGISQKEIDDLNYVERLKIEQEAQRKYVAEEGKKMSELLRVAREKREQEASIIKQNR